MQRNFFVFSFFDIEERAYLTYFLTSNIAREEDIRFINGDLLAREIFLNFFLNIITRLPIVSKTNKNIISIY